MEIDQLKDVWNKQQAPASPLLSNEDMLAVISHSSRSPVARMKRNLRKEMIFCVVAFSIAAFVTFQGKLIWYTWMYLFLMGVFCMYYYFKNRLLNNMQCVTCEVRSNLSMHVATLEKYIKWNLILSTMVFPVVIMFGALIMYLNADSIKSKSILFFSVAHPAWQTALIWLGFGLVFTIPLYYLNRRYLHWLYGKHIDRIKKILSEMDEGQI